MKVIIGALLIATSLLAFCGLANATPPLYYVNREAGSNLYGFSYDEPDGWRYRSVYAWDNYDKKGNYLDSGFWIDEWGYSEALGEEYYRYVSCNMDRGAIQVSPTGTTATFSAYVPDLSSCTTFYSNAEPFTEVNVSATLNDPWRKEKENLTGTEFRENSTFKYSCKLMRVTDYLRVAATVNGEPWLRPAGWFTFKGTALSNVCNLNIN